MQSLNKRAGGAAFFLLLLAIVPAFFTYFTMTERSRRVHVLNEGQQIDAAVVRSDDKGYKRLCIVEYAFQLDGNYYAGRVANCPLMQRYPVGSKVPVRLDPNDPSGSLPVGETVWPGYAVAPLLLWPGWLLVAGFLLFALGRDALSRRKNGSNAFSGQ